MLMIFDRSIQNILEYSLYASVLV